MKITVDIVEWQVADWPSPGPTGIPAAANNTDAMQTLEALAREKKAEILSAGQVVTPDGKTARYANTHEIWHLEKTKDGTWKMRKHENTAGAVYDITPTIQRDVKILLQIAVQTSEVTRRMNLEGPGGSIMIGLPIISSRQMTQSLVIQSGKTMILGGGTSHRTEKSLGQGAERVESKSTIVTVTATVSD